MEWDRIADAVALARAVLELYPSIARAHATYGQTLAASGDERAAAAAYARALQLDPGDTRALESRRRLEPLASVMSGFGREESGCGQIRRNARIGTAAPTSVNGGRERR